MHKFHIDCAKFLYKSNDQNQLLANTENLISKHSLYLILTMQVSCSMFLTMHVRNFKIRSTSSPRRNTRGMFRTRNTNIAWNFYSLMFKNFVILFATMHSIFSIPSGNFHFVQASIPQRLALPASNVAVGSVFNLDFPILYVLHGNKELILMLGLLCFMMIWRNMMIIILWYGHMMVMTHCQDHILT